MFFCFFLSFSIVCFCCTFFACAYLYFFLFFLFFCLHFNTIYLTDIRQAIALFWLVSCFSLPCILIFILHHLLSDESLFVHLLLLLLLACCCCCHLCWTASSSLQHHFGILIILNASSCSWWSSLRLSCSLDHHSTPSPFKSLVSLRYLHSSTCSYLICISFHFVRFSAEL